MTVERSIRAAAFTRERLPDIQSKRGRYLVKPYLPCVGVGVIAGPSTSAKTFLALELGLRVARGEPFNGHRVQQAGVLYVSAEDPEGVRLRIEAWCLENGRHGAFQLIPQAPDLRDVESLSELIQVIREGASELGDDGSPLGLVIIDTLSKASPGADQNSSADMGLVMSALAEISAETGAMVVTIAHTPKDEARGIAGWHGQFAGADMVIMITRDPDDADLRLATLAKIKNGPDGHKLAFRLKVVTVGEDDDGDPVTSCVVLFEDATAARPARKAKPTKPLTPPERLALSAVTHILDHGKTEVAPPTAGVPVGTKAVQMGDVKARAFKTGFSTDGDKPEAAKKRWARAIEGLVSKDRLRKEGDLLWPV